MMTNHHIMPSVVTRSYNANVRVHNWNEEKKRQEDQLNEFLEKHQQGKLTGDIVEQHRQIGLRSVTLGKLPSDGSIPFGILLRLRNFATGGFLGVDVCDNFGEAAANNEKRNIKINLTTGPFHLETMKTPPSLKTPASTDDIPPAARNAVMLLPAGKNTESVVRYGQPFYIAFPEIKPGTVYFLRSERKTFTSSAKYSKHQEAYLTTNKDFACIWQVSFFDPQLRLDQVDEVVNSDARLILTHVNTNQHLASDPVFNYKNDYGIEAEVSVKSCLDSHRAELPANIWQLA